jgi:isopentenyldiphosphate isomerase
MTARVAVVDAQDRFLRWETRQIVHRDQLFHRSIHVLVFDRVPAPGADARLVIQRRHRQKLTYPSHWDLSCSGHVEEPDYPAGPDDRLEEVYAATARREVHEELGVDVEVEALGHFAPMAGVHYEQIGLFRAISAGPFVRQEDEVEEIRLVTTRELDALAAAGDLRTRTLDFFAEMARARGWWA